MNALDTLKGLLDVGSKRLSGEVKRVGSSVTVSTSSGMIVTPRPQVNLSSGDLVILEGNQIIYNLGSKKEIPTYDA
ncbi:hypothetical protein [Vibrio phage vB_ValS_PJ32]|nr:hypothetical protein [Vibrio phage vB_ValS_PJ32]